MQRRREDSAALFTNAPIAQSVEQRTHNPLAVGSSPARRTKNKKAMDTLLRYTGEELRQLCAIINKDDEGLYERYKGDVWLRIDGLAVLQLFVENTGLKEADDLQIFLRAMAEVLLHYAEHQRDDKYKKSLKKAATLVLQAQENFVAHDFDAHFDSIEHWAIECANYAVFAHQSASAADGSDYYLQELQQLFDDFDGEFYLEHGVRKNIYSTFCNPSLEAVSRVIPIERLTEI